MLIAHRVGGTIGDFRRAVVANDCVCGNPRHSPDQDRLTWHGALKFRQGHWPVRQLERVCKFFVSGGGRGGIRSRARRSRAHDLKDHPSELSYAPQLPERPANKRFSLRSHRGHLPACPTIERPSRDAGPIHETSTRPEVSSLSPARLGTKKQSPPLVVTKRGMSKQ